MRLIPLVARRACDFRGRELQVGDRFEASAVDAVLLVTAKKAQFATSRPTAPPAPRIDIPSAVVTPKRPRPPRDPDMTDTTTPKKRPPRRRDVEAEVS